MGLFRPSIVAHAHCDLPCGVYDPAQAKIEAMSVWKAAQKYQDSDDPVFRTRALQIKDERAELVKHHLMVLQADFFTDQHRQQFPNLDSLLLEGLHQASAARQSADPKDGEKLVQICDEIASIFWQTDKGKQSGVAPPA